ncbi:MAG: SbcC/MukB-like Walker B domain-containing protein [Lachnospiraceae bacterium]|nr:SbcC/MukB-like Walker B domain-containing protein [Lachnospiraceae bacterium]
MTEMPKKIITRMCLNNWGGIGHKILEFHEYVNLFSGKSGSGKSTVMDALQVILYGSFSPSFLNRAADDAKNRRSVLGYLLGEQKDGSANREGQDFCAAIVLEIEDTGTHIVNCAGIAFEVHRNDGELRKYIYFSHSGKMPERGYLTEEGLSYTGKEIRKLIQERAASPDNRGRVDVNRIYPSKEAYLNTLYDGILGNIDGSRFGIMERNAIALKMTNGTGQFIRDYMFPKSEADTIADISAQLGAYRDIKEKIEDLRKRISLLDEVKHSGDELLRIKEEIVRTKAVIRYIDIRDSRNKISAGEQEEADLMQQLGRLEEEARQKKTELDQALEALISVRADLKSSDLGSKRKYLVELSRRCSMLAGDSSQWRSITRGLRRWEEDETVTDYISNPLLHEIERFCKGKVTAQQCSHLEEQLKEAGKNIEEELENCNQEKRDTGKRLQELQQLIDDMQNNRKSYDRGLREARAALERRLSDRYGRTIKVYILADLFDVREEEWKNAIEGRLARVKVSLITEPRFAHDAAVLFREMKGYEEIDLINSDAVVKSNPTAAVNSLYEAVEAKEDYVDTCLKQYLGRIQKCHSGEELEQVRNGVTPDCYSYSNFVFRHLRKKDYTARAFIGSSVSRAKLEDYKKKAEKLTKEYRELADMSLALGASRQFEALHSGPEVLVRLSAAEAELAGALAEKQELEQEIKKLSEGKFREMEEKARLLQNRRDELQGQTEKLQMEKREKEERLIQIRSDIRFQTQALEERMQGYISNEDIEREVEAALQKRSGQALKNQKNGEAAALEEKEQEKAEELQNARNHYIRAYPSCGFNGAEQSNQAYLDLLNRYQNDYEPKYQEEFQKQCDFIYQSLRGNVIATIHGDIKAAKRHTYDINRLLRETNFSDSTYQIKIEPAKNENGQFYDMLMAEELDSKNLDNLGFEGQMSLGEDTFFQKYEHKIQLLIDKFMPAREEDEQRMEQRRKEMEKYADYRNYLSFSMFEQVTDAAGKVIRENLVDEMAGRDSGGEGQNPKYVALLAGFAMLYMQQSRRDSKIRLVLLDEAFSKMDQERSAVCLKYARKMNLQLIVCVPDERLQSLVRNVDCVYGFRRYQNRISMMHIDKGDYLKLMEGNEQDV